MLSVSKLLLLSSLLASVFAAPAPTVQFEKRGISQALFDDLTLYAKYSSAAVQLVCPFPVNGVLVKQFSTFITDTQGFVARDDNRKEIIVSFRGSTSPTDFLTDADIILVPFSSPGVAAGEASGANAHQGFLNSYNSVAGTVISTISSQLKEYPDYTLISTGHSLGAALASLGGVSLASNFPNSKLRVFTYGQPRTGDADYAAMAERLIGAANIYRAVHTTDGVPTIIPQFLGFRHHSTEYWNFRDPSRDPANVKQCNGEEDPTCSDSIPSTGINLAHLTYFGQHMGLDPTLCL